MRWRAKHKRDSYQPTPTDLFKQEHDKLQVLHLQHKSRPVKKIINLVIRYCSESLWERGAGEARGAARSTRTAGKLFGAAQVTSRRL